MSKLGFAVHHRDAHGCRAAFGHYWNSPPWRVRYCGAGVAVIQADDQMLLAQQCVANLRKILLEARKVHSRQDYARMAEPILLEAQQREREILEYLSTDLEQPIAV
jgi:hypothetical protein